VTDCQVSQRAPKEKLEETLTSRGVFVEEQTLIIIIIILINL